MLGFLLSMKKPSGAGKVYYLGLLFLMFVVLSPLFLELIMLNSNAELSETMNKDYEYARDLEVKQSDNLDKNIFTLSVVFVSLVVGFMKELKTLSHCARISMFVTVSLFLAAIIITLYSYLFGMYESRCYQHDALNIKYHNLKLIGNIGSAIRYLYCTLFILAMISLFTFFYVSLVF